MNILSAKNYQPKTISHKLQVKPGFTLLEMIVALGIFSILIIIALGTFINVTQLSNKTKNEERMVDQSRFIMELLSREIGTGNSFALYTPGEISLCPREANSGKNIEGWCLLLNNQGNFQVSFYRDSDEILYRRSEEGNLEESLNGALSLVRVTRFDIILSEPGSEEYLTLILAILPKGEENQKPIFFETTIAGRSYNTF